MRGTRWLILAAIVAIFGAVGVTYRMQQGVLRQQAPAKPPALPLELNSSAEDWKWTQTSGTRTVVEIRAQKFGQAKDASRVELERVELRIFHKEGDQYDLVKSAQAEFSPSDKRLYSAGEVEITLGVPANGQQKRTLVSIQSSGVTFDTTTGKASTGQPSRFTFENGKGQAAGASYDPSTKELRMYSQVEIEWKAPGPRSKAMKLETLELLYREAASTISLMPWARLTRDNTVIEAGSTVVTLRDGAIRLIEAQKAHGTDRYPQRQLQYAADQLSVHYGDTGVVEKVSGQTNARLVSTSGVSETTITADRVDLDFADAEGESVLTRAMATGRSVVESKPLPMAGRALPETRLLRAEAIEMRMRAGGREIEMVQTHAPGELEFLANRAGQHHRRLEGERLWITYGPENRVQSFQAVEARTETDPTPEERARNRAAVITRSKNLAAQFDPRTSQMQRMEQWDDFSYQEGERKARASRATLDSAENRIVLETAARLWDSTGSTSADRIRLDQRTGNYTAEGHVNSSRLPDQKKPASGLLSGDEPVQAIARSMSSANRNRLVHYEGKVVLWQGANRIQAERVDIDREKRLLIADGDVATQFLEEPRNDAAIRRAPGTPHDTASSTAAGPRSQAPVLTVVKAARLVYTEPDRLAHYTGGIFLSRPGLQVKGDELRAYLAESGADSRIEKAYADGKVQIVQSAPARTRTGTGEHAEYYTGEEKIILRGGEAHLADSLRGETRGAQLTYFVNDDGLLVNGAADRPASSRIRRK